jgi:predicted O-methyltransferase YrrM
VWWTGVENPDHNEKYGGYDYFKQSKTSWEYWCKKNDCMFISFEIPIEKDLSRFRINWQKAIFVFDELEKRNINYNQICLIDSSSIIKWDAPNFFEMTDNQFTALRDLDNLKWVYESVQGYKNIFNDFKLDISKYVNSGFMIFNESHRQLFKSFKQFYYDNINELIELQDVTVKKGTEQTPMNYWLQLNDIDINLNLPTAFKLTHIHRKDMFSHNWQLNEDLTPFFIKYGYIWFFNGIPKDDRTRIMKETWELVKHNYDENTLLYDKVLNEVKHKDKAKYTTSRKFKMDLLDIFHTEEFRDKSIIELGTSQGMSTRLLSHIFKKVYTVEWDDWNINQAKMNCKDRTNIEFIKADLYNDNWNLPKADVVFVDAGHTYDNVVSDIENSLKYFDNPIFIFDDYGLPPGEVKRAIDEKVTEGKLEINKFIGEKPENLVHAGGTKFFDMEGCVCNL